MKFLPFFLLAFLVASFGKSNSLGYSKKAAKYRAATTEETSIKVSLWD